MKQGQLTVIMIIVILVLLIFGAVTYMTGKMRETKTVEEMKKQTLSRAKIQPIQEFIKSCLDLSAKEALELMGKQGGYLYLSQGGPIPDQIELDHGQEYITYESYDVPFAITKPIGTIADFYYSQTPTYPWKTFPWIIPQTGDMTKSLEGFFGFNHQIKLLKPFRNSVQGQMEVFVKNNVIACADWSTFELQNLQIETQEPFVNVTITNITVFFDMNYPIAITDLGTQATADLNDFTISYPVRLKHVFSFLQWLTDNDITNLEFNMGEAIITNLRTDVIKNVENHDDIVVIRDAESAILGQPFEFRFAVQNRPPALALLNKSNATIQDEMNNFKICGASSPSGFVKPEIRLEQDTIQFTNAVECTPQNLTIDLEIHDPDEDEVDIFLNDITTGETLELESGELGSPYTIRVRVTDGQYEDYQDISFSTEVVPA